MRIRAPRTVARRATVLASLFLRGDAEYEPRGEDAPEICRDLPGWLEGLDLRREATPAEWAILSAPLGTLAEKQIVDAKWSIEAAGTLAWALGLAARPPDRGFCEPPSGALSILEDEARALIES